jgi:hypothetical protein
MRGLVAVLVFCLAAGAAMAQPKKPAPASRPAWAELPVEQQKVLAPLKTDWDALNRDRKLKWIGIAKRYPAMKPEEQGRVQKRMQAWANLTPEQRRQARETFKQLAKQPPEQRDKLRDKWAEYQRQQPALAPREQPEAPDSAKEEAEAEPGDARTIPASPGH